MPATSVHPSAGVYTNEIDLSQRVRAASTSIGAIIGAAPKGPVGERTLVTDKEELRLNFGYGDAKKYGYMLFCAEPFLAQSSQLYVTRLVNGALTAGAYLTVDNPAAAVPQLSLTNFDDGSNNPLGVVDPMNNLAFDPSDPSITNTLMFFAAANPGEWNNKIAVKLRPSNPKGLPVGQGHDVNHFYIDVFYDYTGPNNLPVESFLVSRAHELDGGGRQMFVEDAINGSSNYIRVKNNPLCPIVGVLSEVFEFLDGGTDGDAVTADQVAVAWDLYDDPETLDVNLLISSGYDVPVVHRKMDQVARLRGDAIAILNVPDSEFEVSSAVNYKRNTLNLNSSYSALYGPFIQIRDTANNRLIYIPPSGHIAAAYAFTDTNRAVWFAPAGLSRGQVRVLGVRKKYNQGMRDALDKAQVNVIRFFPGRGYVIWGQETCQSHASAFSNVNVRRLINFMKKSIATAALVGVFDPNDAFLRLQLKRLAEDFLKPIKRGRGLYDFDVICDERNNKNDTIANGDIILDVYADPVIPAKRIHLTAFVNPTGSRFTEGS